MKIIESVKYRAPEIAGAAIGLALAGLLAAMFYMIKVESERPSFSLKKGDWACTLYRTEASVGAAPIVGGTGSVSVAVVPTSTSKCAQWTYISNRGVSQ